MSQDNQVWLINLSDSTRFIDVLTSDFVGVQDEQIIEIMQFSVNSLITELRPLPDWDIHNQQLVHHEHLVQTRSGEGNVRPPTTNLRIPRRIIAYLLSRLLIGLVLIWKTNLYLIRLKRS